MANPGRRANKSLLIRNRQRKCRVDSRRFRKIVGTLLNELLPVASFELGITIVGAVEIARLNETFLRHGGSTDVLAFDYTEGRRQNALHGEIFVCADEARIQAARFRTSWQSELVRYAVHGILHLADYDDKRRTSRRTMKREEDRLLKELGRRFDLSKLAK